MVKLDESTIVTERQSRQSELIRQARERFGSNRDEAVKLVEQALAEARAAKDQGVESQALNLLSDVERTAGNVGRAAELAEQALQPGEACGDERRQAAALDSLTAVSWHKGEFDRAIEFSRRALTLHEQLHAERGVASACGNLSLLYIEKGRKCGGNAGHFPYFSGAPPAFNVEVQQSVRQPHSAF
jgi:tetratricopeptide (TPR) repeat protein